MISPEKGIFRSIKNQELRMKNFLAPLQGSTSGVAPELGVAQLWVLIALQAMRESGIRKSWCPSGRA